MASSHIREQDYMFSCVVCLIPSLHMIYGRCQHRVCASCLYDADGRLKTGFVKCPLCLTSDSFSLTIPTVPEETIAIQRLLGVRECDRTNCGAAFWEWEMQEHISSQHSQQKTPKKNSEAKDQQTKVVVKKGQKTANRISKGIAMQRLKTFYKRNKTY